MTKKKFKRPTSAQREEMKRNHLARPSGVPSEEERFKAVVRGLLAEGLYPGPTLVNTRLGKTPGTRGLRNFSGRENLWRAEVFRERGWVYFGGDGVVRGAQPTWISPEEAKRIASLRRRAAR